MRYEFYYDHDICHASWKMVKNHNSWEAGMAGLGAGMAGDAFSLT